MTPIQVNKVAKAVIELAKENSGHWKREVRAMSLFPDITATSKSTTINGFVVTITIEAEEEEL